MNSTAFETADRMQTNTQSGVPFGGRALSAPVSISLGGMLFCPMNEIWRPVVGYEGLYEVSNLGNVRSLDRISLHKNRWGGVNQILHKGRMLRWDLSKLGYRRVGLSRNGLLRTRTIHKLVCNAFHPNPLNLACVNHKDGIKENNNANNLEHCSQSHNTNHAYAMGLRVPPCLKGEQVGRHKLSDKQAVEIRQLAAVGGNTLASLARQFNIDRTTVSKLVHRHSWKHL